MTYHGPPAGQDGDRFNAYDPELEELQRNTFRYFHEEVNPENGLVKDRTAENAPASTTSVGLALAAYTVGVERGYVSREEAIDRTLTTLRFFHDAPMGPEPDTTGYKGFYYHFLDMETGRRAIRSEISTIDTTFLLAGILAAAAYFGGENAAEQEIRHLAEAIYRRADWNWACDGGETVTHGWYPERGFIESRWTGYSEALLLYVLGLGSPTHPLPASSYAAWTQSYDWRTLYTIDHLYAGPLFIHQLSHVWIDFREIQDAPMREHGSNYFENSRRATIVQQRYAIENPHGFRGYDEHAWGITASAGPGDETLVVDGVEREFYGYRARAVPDGPDDGTLSPWAVVASLPFAPEIVLPTIRHYDRAYPEMIHEYGFRCSFNPTYPVDAVGEAGWVSGGYYGLNQGPIILMIENYRTDMLWNLMKRTPFVVAGLRRAGFCGGWLENFPPSES